MTLNQRMGCPLLLAPQGLPHKDLAKRPYDQAPGLLNVQQAVVHNQDVPDSLDFHDDLDISARGRQS